MQTELRRRLSPGLDDKLAFFKEWIARPKVVGAVAPTSSGMARKMAGVVRPDSQSPVLELGPGTGAITAAIVERGIDPGKLVAIEYSEIFLPRLRQRFPGVNFIHGDAFNVSRIATDLGIDRFDTIISALPLLTMPLGMRHCLVEAMLDWLAPGRPLVQFSYGLRPPVPARSGHYDVDHLSTVLCNLPPARIWAYRRPSADV